MAKSKTQPGTEIGTLIERTPSEIVAVDSILLDPNNANTHDRDGIDFLKASLRVHGQVLPLLVRKATGVLIGGEGRLVAMRELGWETCEARYLDISQTAATALALALNKTQQRSTFDFERVAAQVKALDSDGFDIKTLGWLDHELEPLLAADWTPPAVEPLPTTGADPDEPQPHAVVFPAEMWAAIYRGVLKVREVGDDQDMKESRAIELIVADWMSGR